MSGYPNQCTAFSIIPCTKSMADKKVWWIKRCRINENFCTSNCVLCIEILLISERPLSKIPQHHDIHFDSCWFSLLYGKLSYVCISVLLYCPTNSVVSSCKYVRMHMHSGTLIEQSENSLANGFAISGFHYSQHQCWPTPVLANTSAGQLQCWPTPVLADTSAGRHQCWPTPVLANTSAGRHQCWPTPVLANTSAGLHQCWPTPVLANTSADQLQCWPTPVLAYTSAGQHQCWPTPVLANSSAGQLQC